MEDAAWIREDDVFEYEAVMGKKRSGKTTLIEPSRKKAAPRACGLASRSEELAKLGAATHREYCFGCCYVGEQDSGAVAYEDIMAILNMVRKSIAHTDPVNLALHVAVRYAQLQRDVNDNLMPGEKPLPDWSAATILEHLRYHNTDPELQLWNRISELQQLARVALNASVVMDPDTGQESIDEKQYKAYLDFIKTIEVLQKSDVSKKAFYSGGSHIDMKAASQGFVAISGKKLMSYLQSGKPTYK